MYKVQINEPKLGLSFNVKYENLAKQERPDVEAKAPNGAVVKERVVYQGQVLGQGSTQRKWCDETGNIYEKGDLKFYYEGQEVTEKTQTKIFSITEFQPLKNYTDNYIIAKYYETVPDTDDMKKDFDKEMARVKNLSGMKKLFDYLMVNQVVARGEMNVSSKGFLSTDGFLRAVQFGNKWGLEIGIFGEAKVFQHLQEEVPVPNVSEQPKKLKFV